MSDLPEELFADPVWHALKTRHRHFAIAAGCARRYPAAVAPFAAVTAPTRSALEDLHSLLAPGESIWLPGPSYPQAPGLRQEGILECVQMALPPGSPLERPATDLKRMSAADAPAMIALTDVAFPGFFRARTYQMGTYYGAYANGELIAMGGERLKLDGYSELSGICTHPEHRGKGLATSIIWKLAHDHREEGVVSWLHVGAANTQAIELYRRLGFQEIRRIIINRVARPG
jgi:GNAT superfamily N-acetyltransferase